MHCPQVCSNTVCTRAAVHDRLPTAFFSMQAAEDAADGDEGWETASDSSEDTSMAAATDVSRQPDRESVYSAQAQAGSSVHSGDADSRAASADGADADEWQTWDPRHSLFDNHTSDSLDANLEYMWRRYRFSIPDTEYLVDPAGLLNYLVGPILSAFDQHAASLIKKDTHLAAAKQNSNSAAGMTKRARQKCILCIVLQCLHTYILVSAVLLLTTTFNEADEACVGRHRKCHGAACHCTSEGMNPTQSRWHRSTVCSGI